MRARPLHWSALLFLVVAASPLWSETLVTVRVSSPEQPEGRRRSVFSASEILDLEFHAQLARRLDGDRQIEFRVYTPRGHLYQTLTPAVTTSGDDRQGSRRGRGRLQASVRLPVAGTSIVTSSLYGQWTVVAHLDGSADPVSRPRSFTIKE